MDIEEAKKELLEIKKDNESKAMIINNNSSNMQIRWSNKDLKEMAEISQRCAREIRAIETVLEELENKQDDINILQAQRDSMEYQFKQALLTLEHKDQVINLMALAILNYDDQLVINRYKDLEHVKETFEEILKEEGEEYEQS